MATLNVFGITKNTEQVITTIDELRAAVPVVPELPSAYCLDLRFDNASGSSVQVWYGDPSRDQHQVKVISAFGVDRKFYPTVAEATKAFFRLAEAAL